MIDKYRRDIINYGPPLISVNNIARLIEKDVKRTFQALDTTALHHWWCKGYFLISVTLPANSVRRRFVPMTILNKLE